VGESVGPNEASASVEVVGEGEMVALVEGDINTNHETLQSQTVWNTFRLRIVILETLSLGHGDLVVGLLERFLVDILANYISGTTSPCNVLAGKGIASEYVLTTPSLPRDRPRHA
jgi:hypothetical protein